MEKIFVRDEKKFYRIGYRSNLHELVNNSENEFKKLIRLQGNDDIIIFSYRIFSLSDWPPKFSVRIKHLRRLNSDKAL